MSSPPDPEEQEEDVAMGGDGDDKVDGHGGARVSAAAAENGCGDDDDVEGIKRSPATCCVCMEPWACIGAHRIWSCLERWLRHCGNNTRGGATKWPQCGQRFKLKHITNLYAPSGNLWDDGGSCRILQEQPSPATLALAWLLLEGKGREGTGRPQSHSHRMPLASSCCCCCGGGDGRTTCR
ncbi:hypothetical protein U9M48_005815 [Paspalum notatum var. saurae]|uniref:Uncharacterized protein n=1 Tax=Paspalum notatum var. saurae TaxID=547442 RepID=A0AAQ3PMN4_PASNO